MFEKIVHMHDELKQCLVVFQHDLNDQCLPHDKEKLLLQDPLSQKEKLFTSASTRNHRKRILRCKWTSVALVTVSSESIEPNDNDLEVNAVPYAFAKIFQPQTCWNVTNKFNSSFGDQELLSSSFVDFSSEVNWETGKKHFLYCERFRSVLVVFTNTKTFIEGERKYTRSTTKEDSLGNFCQNKTAKPT